MAYRCAILDDYQNVALKMADWSKVTRTSRSRSSTSRWATPRRSHRALQGFAIVCAMRERTPFPRELIEALPDLRLLITTGAQRLDRSRRPRQARHLGLRHAELRQSDHRHRLGLILELTRRIGCENARLKNGALWQSTVGKDLEGLTLGVHRPGQARPAGWPRSAKAFGMKVMAWSQNLTPERATEAGVEYVASKEELCGKPTS